MKEFAVHSVVNHSSLPVLLVYLCTHICTAPSVTLLTSQIACHKKTYAMYSYRTLVRILMFMAPLSWRSFLKGPSHEVWLETYSFTFLRFKNIFCDLPYFYFSFFILICRNVATGDLIRFFLPGSLETKKSLRIKLQNDAPFAISHWRHLPLMGYCVLNKKCV